VLLDHAPNRLVERPQARHPYQRATVARLKITVDRRRRPLTMSTSGTEGSPGVPLLGVELLKRKLQLVDLTGEIYQGMPMFSLHQAPFIMVNHTHEEALTRFGVSLPFSANNLLISEHTGTHADAIYEYDVDGPTLTDSPLEYYYGDAVCIDVSDTRYPAAIDPTVLAGALGRSGQEIRRGDIVLLYTGHHERMWPSQTYLTEYSGLSESGARWLAERGVVNIGIDAVSIDAADDDQFMAHRVCKEFQIVNTESLTNLSRVANQRFTYLGLPLNIRSGTGSPIRAVALLSD